MGDICNNSIGGYIGKYRYMVAFGHPLNEYPFKIFSKKNYLKIILSKKERIPSTIKIKYILLFD
jgi:hypothetical protein